MPTACEGDLQGALDMLIGQRLTSHSVTLLDIVDWDAKANRAHLWHCGPTDPAWADGRGVELDFKWVEGKDAEGKIRSGNPAVHNMSFAKGPVSILRSTGALDDFLWIDGQVGDDPTPLKGCGAWVQSLVQSEAPLSARALREQLQRQQASHHYTMMKGWKIQ
jgi:hypothetical protein